MTHTLEDLLKDVRNGNYDFTDDGKCIGCGKCCSNILPLSSKDIKDIRRFIEKRKIKPKIHGAGMVSSTDMTCPFRDDIERKCTIYPVRPRICKVFKCDLPRYMTKASNLSGDYHICDVRETFYGKDQ